MCLVGLSDPLYELIRMGQARITSDHAPSKWNHAFLLGERRGRPGKQRIYIFESDLHFSIQEIQFINGPQESLLEKWCRDSIEFVCVLGMPLTSEEEQRVLTKALEIAYERRYRYPVGELFGTLWAMKTGTLHKRNIFDVKHAIQCSRYVRMCYQAIDKDPLADSTDDISNTSPERLSQSPLFTVRHEWHRKAR